MRNEKTKKTATNARCSNCKRRTRLVLTVERGMNDATVDMADTAYGTCRCTLSCTRCGTPLLETVVMFEAPVTSMTGCPEDDDEADDEHSWEVTKTIVDDVAKVAARGIRRGAHGVRGAFILQCICCDAEERVECVRAVTLEQFAQVGAGAATTK